MSISNSIILQGKRIEILKRIKENKEKESFFLKVKASIPIFVYLLNNSKIKKLFLLPSVHRLLSKKILNALEKSGVEIEIMGNKVGRPKIDENRIKEILKEKITDKEKIKKLRISRRAFYYYKKKLI